MHLDLTDEETAALIQEFHDIVVSDHYPFSPRIRTLRAILAKLRPEPVREPLPPKVYAPPRATLARRRRAIVEWRTDGAFLLDWPTGIEQLALLPFWTWPPPAGCRHFATSCPADHPAEENRRA
jgi:hypothetical protein